MYGPTLPFSQELHAEKYREEGEGFSEAMSRVAAATKDSDEHYKSWREILLNQRFLPAGRIQAAMGAARRVTAYNCYVSGTIDDSFVSGGGSIMNRATEAVTTMRMGGGIGYDFSELRPRGSHIKSLNSSASGPVSFMEIYDALCRTIMSAGHRRGAQMGVLRVDHPDVMEFIHAKQNESRLTAFNMSLAVTDEFMECLATGRAFQLKWKGRVYDEIDPVALWETIMRSTWDWAEPGVLFIDTINQMNNLYYCETIAATNPCGEQPLPPFGACLLGSQNLVKYISDGVRPEFDWELFARDIPIVHAGMDNVVDRAIYPLREQEVEASLKRRMGVGITGLANAAERLGFQYGTPEFIAFERKVLRTQLNEFYKASAMRAKDKGSFPMYSAEKFLTGRFVTSGVLDDETLYLMQKNGMRNSHLTSIAPTGTISLTADNVSSGLEPVFAHNVSRTVKGFDGEKIVDLPDYAFARWGLRCKLAENVSVDEHVSVLIAASKYVDSAISKTCNVPSDTNWESFKSIYIRAWEGGAKGCTTYQVAGKRSGILNKAKEPEDAQLTLPGFTAAPPLAEEIDPAPWVCDIVNGVKDCG